MTLLTGRRDSTPNRNVRPGRTNETPEKELRSWLIHSADERCYDYDDSTELARLRIETTTHPLRHADIYARLDVETDDDGIAYQTAYLDHVDGEANDAQVEYALRAIECNDTGVSCA